MARLTKADVLKKAEDLKNWGKWGPDDELGVLNYVTPEDIVNAAKLSAEGAYRRRAQSRRERRRRRLSPRAPCCGAGSESARMPARVLDGAAHVRRDARHVNRPLHADTRRLLRLDVGDHLVNSRP